MMIIMKIGADNGIMMESIMTMIVMDDDDDDDDSDG